MVILKDNNYFSVQYELYIHTEKATLSNVMLFLQLSWNFSSKFKKKGENVFVIPMTLLSYRKI